MNSQARMVAWACVTGVAILTAADCRAQVDPWEFEVYPYVTTPKGMAEFETDNAVITAGHTQGGLGTARGTIASQGMWYNAYEFNYGLTDRLEAALYLNLAKPTSGGLRWAGNNVRLRGRILDQDALPVNLGWYAELEWHKAPQFDDAVRELEVRPIIEKDFGPIAVMLNPKFEKVLAGAGHNQGIEFGYAAAIRYRWKRRFSPSLEFYGGTGLINQPDPIRDQQHYIVPAVWGQLPGGIEYNFGVGYGLTRGSDRVIAKLNLELERFVGAIFK
jgi:hypothetical protein